MYFWECMYFLLCIRCGTLLLRFMLLIYRALVLGCARTRARLILEEVRRPRHTVCGMGWRIFHCGMNVFLETELGVLVRHMHVSLGNSVLDDLTEPKGMRDWSAWAVPSDSRGWVARERVTCCFGLQSIQVPSHFTPARTHGTY